MQSLYFFSQRVDGFEQHEAPATDCTDIMRIENRMIEIHCLNSEIPLWRLNFHHQKKISGFSCQGKKALNWSDGEKKEVLRTWHNDGVRVYFSKARRLHTRTLRVRQQRDKALCRELSQGVGRALYQRIFIKSMLDRNLYVLIFFQ